MFFCVFCVFFAFFHRLQDVNLSVSLTFCFYYFGKRAQIYILKTMKKSKKTQTTQNKWRLLIENISNLKINFSLFSMILYLDFAQKKKRDSTFFFIFTFLCRLLIQRNPKIRLQASIQTIVRVSPFSFDSYIFSFIIFTFFHHQPRIFSLFLYFFTIYQLN